MKSAKLISLIVTFSIISFFSVLSCKGAGSSEGGGGANAPANPGDGYVFVDILKGSLTGNGSKENPVNDISNAIKIAEASDSDICVAAGTYEVDSALLTSITMVEGVSLFGGYENEGWARDVAENVTVIQNMASSGKPSYAILCSAGITDQTAIDGFTISGSASGINACAIFCNGGSPMISNNIIDGGGSGQKVKLTNGIYCLNASPKIANNTITGGTSDSESNGIFCNASNPVISANTIEGGISEDSYSIKCYSESNPVIQKNTLSAQGRIARFGIYEERTKNNNPDSVVGNVFSSTLLAPVKNSGFYRDFSDSSSNINTISAVNTLDSNEMNPTGSVDGNTVL